MSSSRRTRSRRFKQMLGNILVIVLGIVALLLLVGLFLPHQYRVIRTIDTRARPEAVFEQVAGVRHWPEWTVWNRDMDPTLEITYDTPETGVGAGYRWSGKKLGSGSLKISKADPAKGVWYDLEFESGKFRSVGSVLIATNADHLTITWTDEGELGRNPVNRYLGLVMERMVGPDFEKGLERLKAKAEGAASK